MRKKIIQWGLCICCLLSLTGCIGEEEHTNDPQGNFEQLWKIIDEQYCFLDYKRINWEAIGEITRKKITPQMNEYELFELFDNMLSHLNDGHVGLSSSFATTSFNLWNSSPLNFSKSIIEGKNYLGQSFREAAGMKYRILEDNIGYIYYESFQTAIVEKELNKVLADLSNCQGIIFDVRQNSGGNATNSSRIASRFVQKKTLTGYISHKVGSGHSEFSKPYAIYLEPSDGIRWKKKVAVLTNRHSYSATNDFVNHMKGLPNVTIIGDLTGGGAGMPFTSELPNGWTVRFSASPHYDEKMECTEWGIKPDIKVDMDDQFDQREIDSIIETAREFLKK